MSNRFEQQEKVSVSFVLQYVWNKLHNIKRILVEYQRKKQLTEVKKQNDTIINRVISVDFKRARLVR